MFHAGQTKVMHDFWGAAFMQDCPFGHMGWEFRPAFLWQRNQADDNPVELHVSFSGATQFITNLLAMLLLVAGLTLDSQKFHDGPLFWKHFHLSAE